MNQNIRDIIFAYAADPLSDVRAEFHERLRLGEAWAEDSWQHHLHLAGCWNRIRYFAYYLWTGLQHPDVQIVNEIRYLLFKKYDPYDNAWVYHIKELWCGGVDSDLVRDNIEIEIQQLRT